MIKTSVIVARSINGVIGKDGDIPWRLPADLKYFKQKTLGKAIIMGRVTYESLPRVLPDRLYVVISKTLKRSPENAHVHIVPSLGAAKYLLHDCGIKEAWIIGGEKLYKEAVLTCTEMYITNVDVAIPYKLGDKVAKFNMDIDRRIWGQTLSDHHQAEGDAPAHTFTVWKRRSALSREDVLINES